MHQLELAVCPWKKGSKEKKTHEQAVAAANNCKQVVGHKCQDEAKGCQELILKVNYILQLNKLKKSWTLHYPERRASMNKSLIHVHDCISLFKLNFFQKLELCCGLDFVVPKHVSAIDVKVSFSIKIAHSIFS